MAGDLDSGLADRLANDAGVFLIFSVIILFTVLILYMIRKLNAINTIIVIAIIIALTVVFEMYILRITTTTVRTNRKAIAMTSLTFILNTRKNI
jgi:uncharacterized membrane protein